jgi:hypothetical protein
MASNIRILKFQKKHFISDVLVYLQYIPVLDSTRKASMVL